jgi:hypothetical protein
LTQANRVVVSAIACSLFRSTERKSSVSALFFARTVSRIAAKYFPFTLLFTAFVFLIACGGGSTYSPPPPMVSVSLTPTQTAVKAGSEFPFQATVQGSSNSAVTWLVNGVAGGNATAGVVDATGIYTAPSLLPAPPNVTVSAVSQADPTKSASAAVTVTVGVTVSPKIAPLNIGSSQCPVSQQFSAAVTGTTNGNVQWDVNGVAPGDPNAVFGTIDTNGLYFSPGAIPNPPMFHVTATSQADPAQSGSASLIIAAGGPAVSQEMQTAPIFLGTSGGNSTDRTSSACCSGTLGALVRRNGDAFILSNNHVLGRSDHALPGDPISQPGLADSACVPGAEVADFIQSVPLQNPDKMALADAALAQVVAGQVDPRGRILQLGAVNCGLAQPAPPAATLIAAQVGMAVAKSGRTTGLTCGSISDVAVDGVQVRYQNSCGSSSTFTVTFNNQIIIESSTFGGAGDSGSLIVKADTAEPTALLFGGDSTTGITVANPIQDVLAALPDPSNQALPTIVGGPSHAVTACLAASGMAASGASARGLSPLNGKTLAHAKEVKHSHLSEITSDPAVLGVGVGAGDQPGEAAIVVFVERGKAHRPLPTTLDGVPLRIKIIGPIKAYGILSCPAAAAPFSDQLR